MTQKYDNYKSPHFWWIIGNLVALLILSVAYNIVYRQNDTAIVLTYISAASTLLSITLSIFAILYTYVSNVQIQQQFEKINNAAEEIKEAAAKSTIASDSMSANMTEIIAKLGDIDKSQKDISSSLSNLNNPTKMTNLSDYINLISKK